MGPGKRRWSKHQTPLAQLTSIFFQRKQSAPCKRADKYKQEETGVKGSEMVIKVHPIDLSKSTSVGLDELLLKEDTDNCDYHLSNSFCNF